MNSQERYEKIYGDSYKLLHRILVVDDEESMRVLLNEVLTIEGHSVTVAVSGEQAIDLLETHTFDLIITDSHMPGVGGLAVVARPNAFVLGAR